jgi:hypothetical protein
MRVKGLLPAGLSSGEPAIIINQIIEAPLPKLIEARQGLSRRAKALSSPGVTIH